MQFVGLGERAATEIIALKLPLRELCHGELAAEHRLASRPAAEISRPNGFALPWSSQCRQTATTPPSTNSSTPATKLLSSDAR